MACRRLVRGARRGARARHVVGYPGVLAPELEPARPTWQSAASIPSEQGGRRTPGAARVLVSSIAELYRASGTDLSSSLFIPWLSHPSSIRASCRGAPTNGGRFQYFPCSAGSQNLPSTEEGRCEKQRPSDGLARKAAENAIFIVSGPYANGRSGQVPDSPRTPRRVSLDDRWFMWGWTSARFGDATIQTKT